MGGNPYDYYSAYLAENQNYTQLLEKDLNTVGPNYADIIIPKSEWDSLIPVGETIYMEVMGLGVYQLPSNYTANISGGNVRLLNVLPPATIQSTSHRARFYSKKKLSFASTLPTDTYLQSKLLLNPIRFYVCKIGGAGANYFDISFSPHIGRLSSRFILNLLRVISAYTLEVGGAVNAPLALTGVYNITPNGAPNVRSVRFYKIGEFASYANTDAMLLVSDSAPDPKAFEVERPGFGFIRRSAGSTALAVTPTPYSLGISSIDAYHSATLAAPVVIEIYRIFYTTGRVSVGTLTIPANNGVGSFTSPSLTVAPYLGLAAGATFEFEVTTGTPTSPDLWIKIVINPVI